MVESTFDPVLVRGQTPPGLRAPELGVTGDFTITGIPAGRYAILASFENDYLVRDPDICIAGTEIVHQTIAAGEELTLAQSFKVTGSLEVVSPGAGEPEAVSETPTLRWQADASASEYRVSVVDALGNEIWNTTIDGLTAEPSVTYDGPPLATGMYYQFRVVSVPSGDTCEGVSAACDGPEDCGGNACCGTLMGMTANATCSTETECMAGLTLCHTGDDCPALSSNCCSLAQTSVNACFAAPCL